MYTLQIQSVFFFLFCVLYTSEMGTQSLYNLMYKSQQFPDKMKRTSKIIFSCKFTISFLTKCMICITIELFLHNVYESQLIVFSFIAFFQQIRLGPNNHRLFPIFLFVIFLQQLSSSRYCSGTNMELLASYCFVTQV